MELYTKESLKEVIEKSKDEFICQRHYLIIIKV